MRLRAHLPLVLLAFAACGPSTQEVKTAKTAIYSLNDGGQLFSIAEQAAGEEHYKVGIADDGHLTFETEPKWFSSEGDLQTPGAGGYTKVDPHSVKVSFVVAVTQTDAGKFLVTVTPHTYQYLNGSPQLRPLEPDDPNLPPWIHGRADALTLAIYDRAKGFVASN